MMWILAIFFQLLVMGMTTSARGPGAAWMLLLVKCVMSVFAFYCIVQATK